jgi:RNA polymerase sigma factor (sigma-70 family)
MAPAVCCTLIVKSRGKPMANRANESSFEAFAEAIRRWLRHEAYCICGDWYEADDLVQMSLWKIYRRWPHLQRHVELRAYARRVVVSSFLTERRRSRWRYEFTTSKTHDWGQVATGHRAVEDRSVLLAAMNRLGARQRAVLSLRFVQDLSVEQTARALGCAPSTVTSQTVRALATLRRDLK